MATPGGWRDWPVDVATPGGDWPVDEKPAAGSRISVMSTLRHIGLHVAHGLLWGGIVVGIAMAIPGMLLLYPMGLALGQVERALRDEARAARLRREAA